MEVKLVLGYILCEMSDMNIRERDEGGKAWGKCGNKRGKYGKERKSFHRFSKQNVIFGRNQHNMVNQLYFNLKKNFFKAFALCRRLIREYTCCVLLNCFSRV